MQEQIERELKAALLDGDKAKAETLRGLKSALLNEAIAQGVKDTGLDEGQAQTVVAKEAKKRQEAIEVYEKAGEQERADKEKAEKAILDAYLPEQASEEDLAKAVNEEIAKLENPSMADMGKVIGAVKARLGAGADGATVAKLAKGALEPK